MLLCPSNWDVAVTITDVFFPLFSEQQVNSHFPVEPARSQTVNYPAKLIMKLDLIFSETRMQIASEIKLALSFASLHLDACC